MNKKCIVYGCSNHDNEGSFIGDLCGPCYNYLSKGKIGPTDSFLGIIRNKILDLNQFVRSIDAYNLEGDGPTKKERIKQIKELDEIAPTPTDKFQLMFGAMEKEKLNNEIQLFKDKNRILIEACQWAQIELGKHTRPSPIDIALKETTEY